MEPVVGLEEDADVLLTLEENGVTLIIRPLNERAVQHMQAISCALCSTEIEIGQEVRTKEPIMVILGALAPLTVGMPDDTNPERVLLVTSPLQ